MNFEKIVEDLVKYHRENITKPKSKRKYQYKGYDTTSSSILATSLPVSKQLSEDNVIFQEEHNGVKQIEILISCAVQLGIQQGINMCSEQPIKYLESPKQNSFNKKLGDYITKHLK